MPRHFGAVAVLFIAALALPGGKVQAQRGGIDRNGMEYREKTRQQFRLDGGFRAALARERELNKERDEKAIALLTKDQQEELAKLTGKPFDLAELTPRP